MHSMIYLAVGRSWNLSPSGSSELQEIHGEAQLKSTLSFTHNLRGRQQPQKQDDGPPLLLCVDDIRLLEDEASGFA